MHLKLNALWIMCLNIIFYNVDGLTKTEVVDYMTTYIIQNMKVRSVTVIHESPKKLSTLSLNIKSDILSKIPSLNVNSQEMISTFGSKKFQRISKTLLLRSQRAALNVVLIDEENVENLLKTLLQFLTFLINFSPKTPYAKNMVVIMHNNKSLEMRTFFERAWLNNVLNIVVIDVIQSTSCCCQFFKQTNDEFQATLHHYNPFTSHYFTEALSRKTELFVNKFKNMHRFPLKVGLFEDIPSVIIRKNHSMENIWNTIEGVDVLVTKTLATTLNFSVTVTIIDSDNPVLQRFNVSFDYLDKALINEDIDFVVNFFGIIGSIPYEKFIFEPSDLFYSISHHLIVKQYGHSKLKVSCNLIIIIFFIIFIIIIITWGKWLLKFNSKVWTAYNIMRILIGSAICPEPKKIYERIIFLFLAFVSAALSVNVLEQIMDTYLWQESFQNLNTVQDMLDVGIIPSITDDTKKLNIQNDTIMEKLFNISSTINFENGVTPCIESLIHETDKRVNGCEVDGSLGRLIAQSFSYNEHNWIISFVEESLLQSAWATMTFTKRSPYVEHFNVVLRKFFESGLMQRWQDESFTNFTRNYKKYFYGHRLHLSKSARHRNLHIMQARKVPLIKKISILLGMGEVVGIVIFLGEVGWWHFKRWQMKKKR